MGQSPRDSGHQHLCPIAKEGYSVPRRGQGRLPEPYQGTHCLFGSSPPLSFPKAAKGDEPRHPEEWRTSLLQLDEASCLLLCFCQIFPEGC